ncbi:MAG: TVP38/TMEM64 family protein [Acidobacteria bacterium]|nr:TVP38/TMEM64 family protein [Acidobacteriota bacterium]MBI3657986.1 TVP38/TMEM64 family protein [Acidobacteriota bacterium]
MNESHAGSTPAEESLGNISPSRNDRAKWLWYSVISLASLLLVWALLRKLGVDWMAWWELATDRAELEAFVSSFGVYSPLICIAMQFIQVVIFFIPGEVTQIAAGYVFGSFWGFVYSAIGIALGSVFNFFVARKLGRPFVERIVDRNTIDKVDRFMSARKGKTAVALMFLLPGFPKDALCYIVGGVTSVSYLSFFLISTLGRTPALLFSVIFGDKAGDGDRTTLILLGVIFAAFLLFAFWWKKRSPDPGP